MIPLARSSALSVPARWQYISLAAGIYIISENSSLRRALAEALEKAAYFPRPVLKAPGTGWLTGR
jgi:hypothetical protein